MSEIKTGQARSIQICVGYLWKPKAQDDKLIIETSCYR